ncbi:hypothetical protein MY3296_003260 [Beauveria thailandica]
MSAATKPKHSLIESLEVFEEHSVRCLLHDLPSFPLHHNPRRLSSSHSLFLNLFYTLETSQGIRKPGQNSQGHMEDDTTFFPLRLSPLEQWTDFGDDGDHGFTTGAPGDLSALIPLMADKTPEACAARLALLVILCIVFLCCTGIFLYWLIFCLWNKWKIYWQGNRRHLSGLQKFRNLWPQQSAADTNPPSSNAHSSAEQSRRLHWRARVRENLSGRKARASGSGVLQDSVIEPPMPAATTDSRQYVAYMV